MEQPGPSQPTASSSSSATENPIVAVGRKVKSVLSTRQRPSVRILRGSSSAGGSYAGKPSPHDEKAKQSMSRSGTDNSIASRFVDVGHRAGASIRSLFGRDEDDTDDDDDVSFEHEYDADTVDLLDVMGKYSKRSFKAS